MRVADSHNALIRPSATFSRTREKAYLVCYNNRRRRPNVDQLMKLNIDFLLRTLIFVAGGLSAVLLAMKGHAQALPALAVGGMLGAFVARVGTSEK